MNLYDWSEVETEQVNALATRKIIQSENLTVIRRRLLKGSVLNPHRHAEEQFSMIEQGKLRFVVEEQEQIVTSGQALVIEADALHSVEALEDSVVLDLFPSAKKKPKGSAKVR